MSDLVTRDYLSYTEYLPQQFDNSVNLQKLLQGYLTQHQDLHDQIHNLSKTNDITTATGYQLEIIGKLFDCLREGRSDELYRTAIFIKIYELISSGTYSDIHNFLKISTQATKTKFTEYPPSKYVVSFNAPDNVFTDTLGAGETISDRVTPLAIAVDENSVAGVKCLGLIHDVESKGLGHVEVSDVQDSYRYACAGEDFMQCGEDSAMATQIVIPFTAEDTTELWGVYPEDYIVTGFACAGEDFMQCGEEGAIATEIIEEDNLTIKGYGGYSEYYEV